jgi:hypothetical protein
MSTASVATLPGPIVDAAAIGNQRWLAQRFAFWRDRILREDDSAVAAPPDDETVARESAALQLRTLFGLTTFETELIVLAAGLELDANLRAAVAKVQGVSPREPMSLSYALALTLLPQPHWDAMSPIGALRHWALVDFDLTAGIGEARLRIDERVLHFVTGVPAFDERLDGVATLEDEPVEVDDLSVTAATAIAGARRPLVMFPNALADGARRRAGRALARAVLQYAGLHALWVDAAALTAEPGAFAGLARRIDREAALSSAGVVVAVDPDAAQAVTATRLVSALRSPVIALGGMSAAQLADMPQRQVLRFNVPPTYASSARLLRAAARRAADRALQQFHVDDVELDQALSSVVDGDDETLDDRVWDALRESARGGLDSLADRIESRTTFDDLIVPPPVAAQLREIAGQLGQRVRVYEEWGFGARHLRGLGIAALFAGESGTGKTLAAEATRPTHSSAGGARSRTVTTATPTSRSPTCCSGSRAIAASRSSRRT